MEQAGRVLLVDDDRELTSLMNEFLTHQGFAVHVANNGNDGLHHARAGVWDLMLLDVMMPGLDGFEVLRRLRAESKLPVLMLTAKTETTSRIAGLESGADDYLPKPFEPLELVARIKAILRRTKSLDEAAVIELSGVRLDRNSRSAQVGERDLELTSIEYDILEELMRAAGRVVSRDDLMQKLYQRASTPFDRSIDVHISHLRKKIDAPRDLILTIRGVGYQFVA